MKGLGREGLRDAGPRGSGRGNVMKECGATDSEMEGLRVEGEGGSRVWKRAKIATIAQNP